MRSSQVTIRYLERTRWLEISIADNGTELGVYDILYPQIHVPLVWDMTLDGFDLPVIRTACQEVIAHKGELIMIPSMMQPNAMP